MVQVPEIFYRLLSIRTPVIELKLTEVTNEKLSQFFGERSYIDCLSGVMSDQCNPPKHYGVGM